MNRLTNLTGTKRWAAPLRMRCARCTCNHLTPQATPRREIHVLYVHKKEQHGSLPEIRAYNQRRDNSKVILLDVEKCEEEKMKKRFQKHLLGGVLLSSVCICLIEFDQIASLYGYLLSGLLLAFYTFQVYSCSSVILRAVLDVKNRQLLLYPFTLVAKRGMKKQIILSLHEIGLIRTHGKFIRMYFKGHSLLSLLFQHNVLSPLCLPRYTCAQTSEPAKGGADVLYHYDYNSFNVSAFGKGGAAGGAASTRAASTSAYAGAASFGASVGAASASAYAGAAYSAAPPPRVRKNAEGYPLDVAEEAKLLSLLSVGGGSLGGSSSHRRWRG
ncbi:conserved Plasmodium protein, unknown function [Plasmodium vivax]|uniref:(malaria parasite P. vivax) hypothetical protein n=1 Tax=Plasmodium vivax TaxID=5855 RepID=A0A1G4GVN8_PLAVI|nr:unnamed protein product [Plasmodium vivax]CAI7719783.1 conserved Plasmodium protein, unknown function [Plasmodium vivax]SCO66662.1 conserved Plasmodium protein, unknown function [Plasmodium vivax]SCO72094.1 conserved Plasmodium protein, unknown function [Plasmodium vivax]